MVRHGRRLGGDAKWGESDSLAGLRLQPDHGCRFLAGSFGSGGHPLWGHPLWAESAAKSVEGSSYCSRCTVTLGLIRSFSLTALVDCAVLVDPTSTRIKLIIVE